MQLHGNLNQNEVGRGGPENIKMKQHLIMKQNEIREQIRGIFLKINLSTGRLWIDYRLYK